MRGGWDLGQLPDDVLVDRARDGDTLAFEALLRRYQHTMFTLAVRITGSVADAEDAVQQAFTAAWRKLPRFRGDATFGTWLYRIVSNHSLTLLRNRRVAGPLPDDDQHPASPRHSGPEASAQHHALAEALTAALARLPDELRVVWVLRETEGCSYEEVATIVGTTTSTVRGRLARARTSLAAAMADWR